MSDLATAAAGTAASPERGRGCDPVAERAVVALGDLLERAGYRQLYALLAGDAIFAADLGRALETSRTLEREDALLLEIFALGQPVAAASVPGPIAGVAAELLRAGLMDDVRGMLATSGWVVVPALGGLLLTGSPPIYAAREPVGAFAYVGPDSLRLAATLPDARGKKVLDLGTGCGIQGLLALRGPREVVLSDVEDRSLELAALNRVLNATPHPVRLAHGSCFEPVDAERFDLVVTLPPYLPEVPASATSTTVAAGPDGLAVLRQILAGAHAHLGPGGQLVARCQLLCDEDGPLLQRELAGLAPGLDVRLVLTDWHPLQPYVLELATSLAAHGSAGSPRTLVDAYSRSLRGLGATGVCTAVVDLRRPAAHERRHGAVRVLGAAPTLHRTAAPRPTEGLCLSSSPSARVASIPGAAPVVLEGPTAALLAAVDGERSIAELVSVAWGAPVGAATDDLVDQAISRLAQLSRYGLVALVGS